MIRFHLHAVQYVESHLIRIYCSIWQSLDVSGLNIYHALVFVISACSVGAYLKGHRNTGLLNNATLQDISFFTLHLLECLDACHNSTKTYQSYFYACEGMY